MTKAIVLTPEGEVTPIEYTPSTALDTLQHAVDGYIETVGVTPEYSFYANEEGLLREDLIPNPVATAFYRKLGGHTPIKGTVVFVGTPDEEGDDRDVPGHVEDFLKALVALNA